MMRIVIIFEEANPKGPPEQENNKKYTNLGHNIQILHGFMFVFSLLHLVFCGALRSQGW